MENVNNIDLGRAVIEVSGVDAYKFLQGMISNDVGKVTAGNAIYTYLLTPQGKYLFDFFISKQDDKFIIEIAEQDKDEFLKKLKMYKLRSQVEVVDISASHAVYTCAGEGYKDPRNSNLPNRLVANKNSAANGDLKIYHALRIENNVPEGIYDLEKDKSYPLHYRMIELNGVCFKKGCYVGQEVTARTHHRGVIRKTTYVIQGEGLVQGADVVSSSGAVVGKVLSSQGGKAIALLEKEVVESGAALMALGIAIKIV